MHVGRKYTLAEYLRWTKRELLALVGWAFLATFMFAVLDWQVLAIPWTLLALLGMAVSLIIGFKNVECHRRASDALANWGAIYSKSLALANTLLGYIHDEDPTELRRLRVALFHQHFAWLTVLSFQLREPKAWENLAEPGNRDFMAFYTIPERQTRLADELAKYLPDSLLHAVLAYGGDKPSYLLALQSKLLADAYRRRLIDSASIYASVQGVLNDLVMLQGTAQRTKEFPYARNFYSIALVLLRMFVLLVPFGLLGQFHDLGRSAGVERWTIWATIPFSVMLSWIFLTLEKVGENSSNPFEGGANDVPISMLSSKIENEMRLMLDEEGRPSPAAATAATIVL